jgi:ferredoxin
LLKRLEKWELFVYNLVIPNLGRYLMAYKITDECTNCGACEPECPVEAISEKGDMRVIDPDACTDCGACAEVCPVEAIVAG